MLDELYYMDSHGYTELWHQYPTEMAFLEYMVTEEIEKGFNYFYCARPSTTVTQEIFDFFENNGFKYENNDCDDNTIRITIMKKVPFC